MTTATLRLHAVSDMHAIWRDGPGLGHAASCWPSMTGSRPMGLIEWVLLLGQLRQVLSQALSNWPSGPVEQVTGQQHKAGSPIGAQHLFGPQKPLLEKEMNTQTACQILAWRR
jgi:hypothetical protein